MTNIFFHLSKPIKVKFTVGIVFVVSLLFTFHSIEALAGSKVRVGEKVPNFVLEGADGNQYELDQMKGKVIIMVMGPRKRSENTTKWVEMLNQTFPKNDSLEIFSVFDVRGIPFFISKGFVRKKVKEKQEEHPVTILMDWKQKVNKLLGAHKDETDIFVIGPDGVLVSHQVGTYSEDKLKLLRKKIEKTLESSGSKKK